MLASTEGLQVVDIPEGSDAQPPTCLTEHRSVLVLAKGEAATGSESWSCLLDLRILRSSPKKLRWLERRLSVYGDQCLHITPSHLHKFRPKMPPSQSYIIDTDTRAPYVALKYPMINCAARPHAKCHSNPGRSFNFEVLLLETT